MIEKKYHCPRCGNKDVIYYSHSFDCPSCEREFEKKDCDELEDSQILAVEEKLGTVDAMGLDSNENTNSLD